MSLKKHLKIIIDFKFIFYFPSLFFSTFSFYFLSLKFYWNQIYPKRIIHKVFFLVTSDFSILQINDFLNLKVFYKFYQSLKVYLIVIL